MPRNTFLDFAKVTKILDGAASAGTLLTSAALDMAGYDGVIIFGRVATANAGNFMKAQQCDTSGGTYADLEGTKVVTGDDGDMAVIEIYRPQERYLKVSITRAGANTVTGDVYAVQFDPKAAPATLASIMDHERHVSPDEGTA